MGLLTDFFIESYLNDECNVVVRDITSYPWSGYDRREVALFYFYDKNSFAGDIDGTDDSNANQNDIQSTFSFAPVVGYTYSIRCFVVPIWTANIYPAGSIVWDDSTNAFYYTAAGATAVQAPSIIGSIAWVQIDVSTQALKNSYLNLFNLADFLGYLHGYVDEAIDVDCPAYTITKTACYLYTIEDTSNDTSEKTLTVYSYETGTTIITDTIDPTLDTTYDLDLTSYGDGAYLVHLYVTTGGISSRFFNEYYVIYEYCSIWNCYQSIFQSLMCGQYNPCCNTCDLDTIRQNEKYREQLNIITGFMMSIWAYINVEQVAYLGNPVLTEERGEFASRVGDYIVKAKDLISTCGWCNASDVSTDTNPCSSCE